MLDGLVEYSRFKGLTVNPGKSKVMVFHSRKAVNQTFRYGEHLLEMVDEFKYLGMVFNKDGSMKHADQQWSRAMCGAAYNSVSLAAEYGLSKRVDIALSLFQTYARSQGMYGSQIWSTPFLEIDKIFDSDVQSRHLSFLRFLTKIKRGTSRWALLHELGQKPFQFNWWKAVARFWNKMIESNNNLLSAVMKADAGLAQAGVACWTSEVKKALDSLPVVGDEHMVPAEDRLMMQEKINVGGIILRVKKQYNIVWNQFERAGMNSWRSGVVENRKTVTYANCFKSVDLFNGDNRYLRSDQFSFYDALRILRFKVGAHNLEVERGRYSRPRTPWNMRYCSRCSESHLNFTDCPVDDEYHMIFECEAFSDSRSEVSECIQTSDGSIRNLFMQGDFVKVYKFVSSCMKAIDMKRALPVGHGRAASPG